MKQLATSLLSSVFLLVLSAGPGKLQAQVIQPVTAIAQSTPPHSGNLAELAAPGVNKLGVSMILNDRNELSYQVRLVVEIEGQGIRLKTRPEFVPRPITLSYGIPVQIKGADLAEYLNINHLDFSGFTREQYLAQGSLPDGMYSVCFTVYDYDRGEQRPVSLRSCTGIMAIKHDPPVVISPVGFQDPLFPQNLTVQWQPRHAAGFPVQYTLQLFEFPQGSTLTPDLVAQYEQPFVEKTINTITTTFIAPGDPVLQLGQRYLIRVRAQDLTMQNQFHNDGWSAPDFFTYGEACRPPDNIAAVSQSESAIRVTWQPLPGFNRYVVRYRERDTPGANWYEEETVLSTVMLQDLSDNTAYEVQVKTYCNGEFEGPFSSSATAVTDAIEFANFDCTNPSTFPTPTNTEPIALLRFGDIVTIGGFQMRITQVTPAANGGWKGVGQIRVPWLLGRRFICTFDSLRVNTERQVFFGTARAFSQGLNSIPGWKSPEEVMAELAALPPIDFCASATSVDTSAVAAATSAGAGSAAGAGANNNSGSSSGSGVGSGSGTGGAAGSGAASGSTGAGAGASTPGGAAGTPADSTIVQQQQDAGVLANPFANYSDPASLPFDIGLNAGGSVLPVVLGGFPNAIVVDGLQFTPTGAKLNAYFSAALPGVSRPAGSSSGSASGSASGNAGASAGAGAGANASSNSSSSAVYVAFKALNVGFHPGGLLGEGRMTLVSDISGAWKNNIKLTIKGGNSTYVSFNCRGLSGIGIQGEVEFCPNLLRSVTNDSLQVDTTSNVKGSFVTSMPRWGQFTADLSVTPFEVPQLPGWAWQVQNMVFDFSDQTTPSSVQFPAGYTHPDVVNPATGGTGNPRWTGFYIGAARVKVPEKFYGSAQRPFQVAVSNLIVDQTGFTGLVSAINVFAIDTGRIGNWAFSMDTLTIGIRSNQFQQVRFAGKMQVPAFDQPLKYGCVISPGSEYAFTVGVSDTLKMSAWRADVALYQNSRIEIGYNQATRKFWGTAYMTGRASLRPTAGAKDTLYLPNLTFEGFVVSTNAPYLINIGNWEYSSGQQKRFAGYPITINSLALRQTPPSDGAPHSTVALGIGAALNLSGSSEGSGLSAEGYVRILFRVYLDSATQRQRWQFHTVKVDSFLIDASGAGFEFVGSIKFYENHATYGSGFRGMIQATFTPRITVSAVAQFGQIHATRYWFVDALVSFDPGINIGATGLALYGFGGGASYRVRREQFVNILLPDSVGVHRPQNLDTQIGLSLSGVIYVPDSTVELGIKAMVALGTVKRELFNANLTFEIVFNANWGLRSIGFIGDARFMTPPPRPGQQQPNPALRCVLDMSYDFQDRVFHATLDVYVNSPPLKGAYLNNLAGRGVIHASAESWYIWLGTPQRRFMLSYSLAGLANMAKPPAGNSANNNANNNNSADTLQVDWTNAGLVLAAYLNVGSVLPPFPDVPERVRSILGMGSLQAARDDPRFASGGGIMFGASLEASMPELTFLVFYASFYAGIGFDIMLRDYGVEARCAGNESSSNPIGVNGWYATGQIWAYLEGDIGIKVNLGIIKGKFSIISLAVAAVLQARLPNPFWMRGIVGGRFSILGGLIKGSCRFQFEAGKRCDIVGANELQGIEVIASTKPDANSSQAVDVFARPQATFNFPMEQAFELINDDGNRVHYRPKLREFSIKKLDAGGNVTGEVTGLVRWSNGNEVVDIRPNDVLDGNTRYRLTVVVGFEKKPYNSNTWSELRKPNGTPELQQKIVNFTTGPAPDYIPAHNVAYSYPMPDQFNFLPGESTQGYVQLIQGQAYLFKGNSSWEFAHEASRWEQRLQFISGSTAIGTSALSYNNATRRVSFSIPAGLPNDRILRMSLTNVPVGQDAAVDANVALIEAELLNEAGEAGDTLFTNILKEDRIAQSVQRGLKPKSFYASSLRTSLFNTFAQKFNALNKTVTWFNPQFLDPNVNSGVSIDNFGVFVTGTELFDLFDQSGWINPQDSLVKPLVRLEADLSVTPNNWYNNVIFPYMYQHFPAPAQNVTLSWRDPQIHGDVPVRAVKVEQAGEPHKLTQQHIESGSATIPLPTTTFAYKVPFHMIFDSFDYKNKVANFMAGNANVPQAWVNFMQGNFTYPPFGAYKIVAKYFPPGSATPTSEMPLNINYNANNN